MLRTAFTPGWDGLCDWDLLHSEALPTWLIKPLFTVAKEQALTNLNNDFFDAVELYDLSRHITRWITGADLSRCAREAGKLNATMDFAAENLPLPRHIGRLRGKKAIGFHRYLNQRSLDNLKVNLAGLLQALAILSLIPNEWFPQKALEDRIEDQIRRLGFYRQVQVDCELNLSPGGMRWMAGTTLKAVEQVRARLARGQPCLARLVRSLDGLEGNRQTIVYACQAQPDGGWRLELFELDCVLDEHAVHISPHGDVLEIAPPGRPLPILGLLCESYSPVAPPRQCIPCWWRHPAMRRIWRLL